MTSTMVSGDKTGREREDFLELRDHQRVESEDTAAFQFEIISAKEVWRMMNFRQRMGWVGVALYLLLSVMVVYYIFEVHSFKLEHVQRSGAGPSAPPLAISWSQSLSTGLPPLPVWMWASVFLLPYLQLFLFLFSCTRANPRAVGYCVLPVCLVLLCSRHHGTHKLANQRGPTLIDT